MDVPPIHGLAIAFCGIARPEQFFAGLVSAGIQLAGRIAFPDHHPYTPTDVNKLISAARATKAIALLTTEKDAVRLGPLAASFPPDLQVVPVPLRTEIDQEETALDDLLARLGAIQS